jgi:tRNA threonylcarbamoyl adenosine modification protein YeaZ
LLLPDRVILREEAMATGQAERLMPLLEEVLAEAGIGWRDLSTLAVGTGPGNFTGVRIAVAAARGLALALGMPAVGVTRLEALAHGLPRPLRVIEDARRGMVYVQDFPATGAAPRGWPRPGHCRPAGASPAAARRARPCPRQCHWPRPSPGSPPRCPIDAARTAGQEGRPAPGPLLPAWRRCRAAVRSAAGDPAVTPIELAALHARAFRTPPPWSAADFAAFVADPLAFLLVEGDAGFLLGRAVAGEAELLTLAVAPEARRRGLGRRLVGGSSIRRGCAAPKPPFSRSAPKTPAAIALYDSAGFRLSGRRRGYYATSEGRRIDALAGRSDTPRPAGADRRARVHRQSLTNGSGFRQPTRIRLDPPFGLTAIMAPIHPRPAVRRRAGGLGGTVVHQPGARPMTF